MKIIFRVYITVYIVFIIIKVNTIAMENSFCTVSRELDTQCGSYCYKIVKPLLEHAAAVQLREHAIGLKEKEFTELKDKLNISLISEESLKSQIKIQLKLIESLETQNSVKDALIAEKDKLISQLQAQTSESESEKDKINFRERANVKSQQTSDLSLTHVHIKQLKTDLFCNKIFPDLHTIKIPEIRIFSVPCYSDIAGYGWTVIQQRINGSVNFNRNWTEYTEGFGDIRGEFFIGLQKLHLLTKFQPHELYIHLMDFENKTRYARYSHFLIGNEKESYELKKINDFSGNAGDSMAQLLNMKFSTPDRDNDKNQKHNCAYQYKSGWWFKNCSSSNLNGIYNPNANARSKPGIKWNTLHYKSLQSVRMMIRPRET